MEQNISSQNNTGNYWDPTTQIMDKETLMATNQADNDLVQQFESLKQHPKSLKHKLIIYIIVMVVIWLILIAIGIIASNSNSFEFGQSISVYITVYFIALALPLIYYNSIIELQKKLSKLLIAEEYKWLYDPSVRYDKWSALVKIYPEIFNKGNFNQFIFDQFWGSLNNDQAPFWIGIFHYTMQEGRSSSDYSELVYAFPLPHRVAADFVLKPQSTLTKIKTELQSSLTTESIDFNKAFHIDYQGKINQVGTDILQVLTPTAQEHLLNLRNTCGPFVLVFRENTMFILFNVYKFNLHYTNFFKKIAIDQRDADNLLKILFSTTKLADEILPCID